MSRKLITLFSAALLMVACGGGDDDDDVSVDASGNTPDAIALPDASPVGPNPITITFSIDDTANQTYGSSDGLAWKGSFSYDAGTNTIVHDPAWNGPFVPVRDDGPPSSGGHEPEGATAGDHIFTVSVLYVPDEQRDFSYGAIRGSVDGADGEWIWVGDNGTFVVNADSTTNVTLPAFAIPAFGDVDMKLTLDTGALHTDFSSFNPADGVKVKGSGWGWTEVALVDDATAGDDTASDGVFTFVLSQHTGAGSDLPHNGKLNGGTRAEFVFVLGTDEYKVGTDALPDGAAAATWGTSDSDWVTRAISVDTGATGNTYIDIP